MRLKTHTRLTSIKTITQRSGERNEFQGLYTIYEMV